ncbi:MAG TPA: hypothetical protein VFW83_00730, partial [Bryobacteraceae bacterium]|nr:hypothetical protein [Bryobacteraceae bacterium]
MAVLLSSAPVQAQSVFSHNLIVNGNAELGPGNDGSSAPASIPGWTAAGSPRVISYASGFDLSPTSIIPANHGNNYFAGGQGQATSSLTQSIDLSSGGSTIDGGNVTFDVSGYLGGQGEDTATLSLAFLGTSGNQLNTVTLGPITQDDKSDSSALYLRRNIGPVPSGARKAVLTLTMTRSSGGNNDGYA